MKNRVLTAFRLPTAQNNAVTELAKQQGTTRTKAVEMLISAGIQTLKSAPQ